MNLKLNNDMRTAHAPHLKEKPHPSSVKEERRRTGRYIAILVGILLFLLAIYHAWVRRIPVVASLVVPALIMFIYVGWVLYTASRDKHKLMDAEAARLAAQKMELEVTISELTPRDLSIASSKDSRRASLVDEAKHDRTPPNNVKNNNARDDETRHFIKPIILINDKPPDDSDQIYLQIINTVVNNEKFKGLQTNKKFKRKFCRSKRNAVFKRSYSIA